MKGNGIIQAKVAIAQLVNENHKLGLKVSDLLEQNDRQEKEIARLKKLSSNYGTVCKDCCTAVQREEELTAQNEALSGDMDSMKLLCTLMGCVFFAVFIMYAMGVLTIAWRGL